MSESIEKYMQRLRNWLSETADGDLEEMSDFFTKRLDGYEEHMSIWKSSYQKFAEMIPQGCKNILDLGCGTGLELDEIWKKNPDISVLGIDLCRNMLDKLLEKHSEKCHNKKLETVCEDYFKYDFGQEKWDAVISFESLHHFMPDKKGGLYQKIFHALRAGGEFILGDYIACCEEEEELLRNVYLEKRRKAGIPEERFVHFDIPLTLEHEKELLRKAGFADIEAVDCSDAVIIVAKRG